MKHFFEPGAVAEVKARIQHLRPDSQRQWGTMNAAQAVAHCIGGLEIAVGERKPPRVFMGRLIGWAVKPMALGNDAPLRRNTPTVPGIAVADTRDLEIERKRLLALIDRIAGAGPSSLTTHPHSFFGRMTPQEWSVLMYKHLDHHLRQFGV